VASAEAGVHLVPLRSGRQGAAAGGGRRILVVSRGLGGGWLGRPAGSWRILLGVVLIGHVCLLRLGRRTLGRASGSRAYCRLAMPTRKRATISRQKATRVAMKSSVMRSRVPATLV
jgi:hypothetical protein